MADAQRAGRRALLHARGDVHGRTHGGVVSLDTGAQCHVAGVQAHAHGEAVDAVQAPCRIGLFAPGFDNGQNGAHGTLGLVLQRRVHAEGGLDAVTS